MLFENVFKAFCNNLTLFKLINVMPSYTLPEKSQVAMFIVDNEQSYYELYYLLKLIKVRL